MKRLPGATTLLLVLAAGWGLVQFALAFFVYVAVRGHAVGSAWVVPPPRTYMQAYGVSEVVLTVVALALGIGVAVALRRGMNRSAWAVSVVTAALGALGFVYLLGVGICLLLACASVRRGAPSAVTVAP